MLKSLVQEKDVFQRENIYFIPTVLLPFKLFHLEDNEILLFWLWTCFYLNIYRALAMYTSPVKLYKYKIFKNVLEILHFQFSVGKKHTN